MFDDKYVSMYLELEGILLKRLNISSYKLEQHILSIMDKNLKRDYLELCEIKKDFHITFRVFENVIHFADNYDEFIAETDRVVTGSYYTPKFIIENMLDSIFKLDEISKKIKRKQILEILEPSSGNMLFVRLLSKKIYDISLDVDYVKRIISHINVVDINSKPLILGILLWIYEMYECIGEWQIRPNLICDNALFLDCFENKMDLVIGNPPYLGEKGNCELFKIYKNHPMTSKYYTARMDLYYLFIHRAIDYLKPCGFISYITTNYFKTADSGKVLRADIMQRTMFRQITNYIGGDVFKSARGQHNNSFILEKMCSDKKSCVLETVWTKKNSVQLISSELIDSVFDDRGQVFFESKMVRDLINKILSHCDCCIASDFDVKQGIISGADRFSARLKNRYLDVIDERVKLGEGIFVFNVEEVTNFKCEDFYKNSDITKYTIKTKPKYKILYIDKNEVINGDIKNHLTKYKSVLSERREVKKGYINWYELQWARSRALFTQPKIVVPQRNHKNVFAYVEHEFYASADVYYIIHKNRDINALKYLTAILNSKLYYFILYHRGKRKGELLELYSTPIKSLRIKNYLGLDWQLELVQYIDEIILMSKNSKSYLYIIEKIDDLIYKEYGLNPSDMQIIENCNIGES